MKQKLVNFASKKDELLKKDPASIVMQFNPNVKDKYSDFQNEQDPAIKELKFKKYIGSVVDAQKTLGVNDEKIKIIPQQDASRIVQDYNNQDVNGKIKYLNDLEKTYGDNYDKLLNQLSEPNNGLPITAKLVSYFGDPNFAKQALSIDSKEERDRLDKYISTTVETKKTVNQSVGDNLIEFRKVVMKANQANTSKANKDLENIQDVISYIAINKMSAGVGKGDAIKQATSYITENFTLKDTYFIPRINNNDVLTKTKIDHVANKDQNYLKYFVDQMDIEPFKSTNKNISDEMLNKEMKRQIKDNGIWVNSADGNGIVLSVKFADGSVGLVSNKKGEVIKINFDDTSFKIPGTNTDMNTSLLKTETKFKYFGGL
jgi:hypothetical protein